MDSKITNNTTPRPNYIKAQSYNMGKKMLAKLSKKSQSTKIPMTQFDDDQEDRNSLVDDSTIGSQESGTSSSLQVQYAFCNGKNLFDREKKKGVWSTKAGSCGARNKWWKHNSTMNNSYGSSQSQFVFDGVYA